MLITHQKASRLQIGAVGISLALVIAASPALAAKYKVLRYDEDPASYRDDSSSLKYVELNDAGDVYFGMGGQVRVRWEVWDNFGFSPANDDDFILTRLRLHGDLRVKEILRIFIEGKSALSTHRNLPGGRRILDEDTLDLQNAFLDLAIPVGDNTLTLRSGRQELLYGKQRLVSPLDWSNTRRTFDGIRSLYQGDDWSVDTFWSRLVRIRQHDFNDNETDTDFYGIYATHRLPDSGMSYDTYILVIDRDTGVFDSGSADEERYTVGLRVAGVVADTAFDYDVEGAYQFGDYGSENIAAYFFASQLGYIMNTTAKPRLYVGFDYASGDSDPTDGELGTFNQLFPLGHAYHGYIDIVGRQNISDLSMGVSVAPTERFSVKLDGHFFWRADESDALYNAGGGIVRAGDTSDERFVGQEIDLTIKYKIDVHTLAVFGYSHFFPGDFIDESGPDQDIDFVYTTLQYTF